MPTPAQRKGPYSQQHWSFNDDSKRLSSSLRLYLPSLQWQSNWHLDIKPKLNRVSAFLTHCHLPQTNKGMVIRLWYLQECTPCHSTGRSEVKVSCRTAPSKLRVSLMRKEEKLSSKIEGWRNRKKYWNLPSLWRLTGIFLSTERTKKDIDGIWSILPSFFFFNF